MEEQFYRLGLDVGSTTAKVALTDSEGKLVYSEYQRHNAKVGQIVGQYLDEIKRQFGDIRLAVCVTGSVGMQTAEQLKAEFLQEVVAATVYARKIHPEAKALIDIGGEDAKVVFFNGRNTELRMNGNCAGGTGAFLDQMAVLMGTDNKHMNDMAMKATAVYPMAARCGVFAKTDIQNLMSRNLPEADIAASIFHSIAVQTVTTLSHGQDFTPPILLCGGPLTFLPALRKAFSDYLHLPAEDFIVSDHSNLIPALGCALRAGESSDTVSVSELRRRLDDKQEVHWHSDLKPLFVSEQEHKQWLQSKEKYATRVGHFEKGLQQVVIGIDSGSTTTKIVALRVNGSKPDPDGRDIVFTNYRLNLGNPIKAVADGLKAMQEEASHAGADLRIVGSCSTGYGEELIKTAFHLDSGIIETMAHYRAARQLMPDVSFILDIGGQDMKAIFVENGAVTRMELNEACSSGCGTFIQTFANGLQYSVEDFARMACTASAPCDLGTRCTVFMNSKVKQVLREGATVADISAGISYSVIKNCLYKVLKLRGRDSLGQHIVLQGGTMRNDSVVRAFELLTGTDVARSNMPELMGAIGCALHALEQVQNAASASAGSSQQGATVSDLLAQSSYETKMLQCKGCENHCLVSRYTFADGQKFYSGNKCERVFNNQGRGAVRGENIYTFKYHQLFDRAKEDEPKEPRLTIGIPRVLNMYEDFPFWHALLTTCGFRVRLSSESTFRRYESALSSVMSDNICFPAKLVHSHIAELNSDSSVDRILMPYVVYERNEDPKRTINSYNCPIVSAYADVIRSAMDLSKPLDAPVINFSDNSLLEKQIVSYLGQLGVSKREARLALGHALEAQHHYAGVMKQRAEDILQESRRNGQLTILLAGRPYHTDPLIQHKLSEMIASLGADVISDDIVRDDTVDNPGETYVVKQWAYMNRIMKSGQWAAAQGNDLHFVEMTSFGCGPDAFLQDEIRDILKRAGKPFTLLKIDDVSNIGSLKLRVRSLVESLKMKRDKSEVRHEPLVETRVFTRKDVHRKILAPFMTEYLSAVIPPALQLMGYDVEVLPMSDRESAELGLRYANNEICYPATLIIGDIIKALKSGRYDLDNTAVAMSQTGGQCRATSYAGLIKRAMVANGFEKVPLITLGVTAHSDDTNTEQEGFSIDWKKYSQIAITCILFGDAISEMYNACIVREREKGVAARLRDEYMRRCQPIIAANNPDGLIKLLREAAVRFDEATLTREVPKVGIVGEIFLKFNHYSHQFIEKYIVSKGFEVVPPLLAPFFLQEFVNFEAKKHLRLQCSRVPDFVVRGIYQALIGRRIRQVNKVCSKFRYFRPFTNIYDDARQVDGVVSMAAQFGEGWLLPSDIIGFVRDGVKNVISLQPFGCIANHIISKGIEKKLHKLYPDLNLVSLDFDSGVSAVNVTNRLLLFLDNIA